MMIEKPPKAEPASGPRCADCGDPATVFVENIWKQSTPLCFSCRTRRANGKK